jgi:hypothetical protein
LINWLDIAYLTLDLLIAFYCFKKHSISNKKAYQLFGLAFIFLIISDFLWVFAIPWLSFALILFSYVRLGFYTVFILLILRALQLLDKKPEAPNDQNA